MNQDQIWSQVIAINQFGALAGNDDLSRQASLLERVEKDRQRRGMDGRLDILDRRQAGTSQVNPVNLVESG